MSGQTFTLADAATAHMHNHLEILGCSLYPCFCQLHAFFFGKHIAFTTASVYKYALQPVLLQHLCIGGDGFQIQIAILIERGERRINKSNYFFHDIYYS